MIDSKSVNIDSINVERADTVWAMVERDADSGRRMTTREAAERLGVKPETVYAYVSRGQLTSHRAPGGAAAPSIRRRSTRCCGVPRAASRRPSRAPRSAPGSR
ncbi:helix-turn-helix domain-containing protein [Streptomyces sp. M19]